MTLLLVIFIVCLISMILLVGGGIPRVLLSSPSKESFVGWGGSLSGVSLQTMSSAALDKAPSTSEVKDAYKLLLLYAGASIKAGGDEAVKALRILADLRDRLFDERDFRDTLTTDDFLGDWPPWLPPLDTTIAEPTYTCADAAVAESQVLAYLQRYFPQEDSVDEQTGSTIRNLIEDIGTRFVFEPGDPVNLSETFLRTPLLRGWVSPCSVARRNLPPK